jgi:hypothetical protein
LLAAIDCAFDLACAIRGQHNFGQFAEFATEFCIAEWRLKIAAMTVAGLGALPAIS